jgi:acyl-CoA reductase-like NAD-dependent aldehyde dehydrogenase
MSTKRTKSKKLDVSVSPVERQGVKVLKTYKLLIGGALVRSESEREYVVNGPKGAIVARACRGSRKDVKHAVKVAREAHIGWAGRTAYNRAQIIYRIAEMLEARRMQFVAELHACGASRVAAEREVQATIDLCVHYAGWADKYQQLLGSVNPVAGNYFNFSCAEPIGTVGVVAPETPALEGLLRMVLPPLCAGNAVVALLSEGGATVGLTFSEVFLTSDVPPGCVNLVSGFRAETAPTLLSHMDVGAIISRREDLEPFLKDVMEIAANLKRVINPPSDLHAWEPLSALEACSEVKTTWHPVAV